MPKIKIPVVAPPYPTLDDIELDRNSVSINDAYIDEAGFLVKRPGLDEVVDIGTASPIDGLSYWEGIDRLVAVSAGKCFLVNLNDNTFIEIGNTLQLANRPTFAFTKINGQDYMAVTNGGIMHISIAGANLVQITDASAPVGVTHVVWAKNRLVANEGNSDRFWWSAQFDPFTWDNDFATAEGEPDAITAIYRSWNELVIIGSNTIEFWYDNDDATIPFLRMQGTQANQGTLSPDAVVFDFEDSKYYFLDSDRNVNVLVNRTVTGISPAIDKQLQALETITDARLSWVKFGSHKFLVLTFPTENITFVHDITTGFWFQWGKFNELNSEYNAFLGRSMVWANKVGKNYAGSALSNGKIFLFSTDIFQDDEEIIRAALKSGWINTGDLVSKTWRTLLFRIKRQPNSGSTYEVLFRKDTEGSNAIERSNTIDLGTSANVPFVQRLHNFGTARAVQFEISCSADVPFIVGDFELEYKLNRV